MKNEIKVNEKLIAYCGLYCAACKKYLNGKCPGCQENEKASWCKIRKCNIENNFKSCADCTLIQLEDCKIYNNFIGKVFGFVFNSDRAACINYIKVNGYQAFAKEMTEKKIMTFKRK